MGFWGPYETALSYEHEVYPYDHSPNSEGEGGFSENFLVSEYTLLEKAHSASAFIDTFAALYPQLQEIIDFRDGDRTCNTRLLRAGCTRGRWSAPSRSRSGTR